MDYAKRTFDWSNQVVNELSLRDFHLPNAPGPSLNNSREKCWCPVALFNVPRSYRSMEYSWEKNTSVAGSLIPREILETCIRDNSICSYISSIACLKC